MGLSLLFPLGLAALAAVLLPLLIHLARREESRLTEFAALRWLRARPKPRRRVRFDEWPLLLVRLLLLALIALLMAGLAWQARDDARPRVLVSPGVDAAALRALKLAGDARVQWLAGGFPALEAPVPAQPQPVASLLREFDAQLPPAAPLRIIVPADWGAVDAQRPLLSRPVTWTVIDGHSPGPPAAGRAPLQLAAVGVGEGTAAWRTLRALNAAWSSRTATLAVADIASSHPPRPGTLVAWGSTAVPSTAWLDWVRDGGQLLLVSPIRWPIDSPPAAEWRDTRGEVLLSSAALGRGRLWRWSGSLDPATTPRLLDPAFPADLARHLRPTPSPARAAAADFAPLVRVRQWPRPPAGLVPGAALLIALVFALERWMATSPRRGAHG